MSELDNEGESTSLLPSSGLHHRSHSRSMAETKAVSTEAKESPLETSLAFNLSELNTLDSVAQMAWRKKLTKVIARNSEGLNLGVVRVQRREDLRDYDEDIFLDWDGFQRANPDESEKLLTLLKAEVKAAKENENIGYLKPAGSLVAMGVLFGGVFAGVHSQSLPTAFGAWGTAMGIGLCAILLGNFAYEYYRQKSLEPQKTTQEHRKSAYENCDDSHKKQEISNKIDAALGSAARPVAESKSPDNKIRNRLFSELGAISAISAKHARFWVDAISEKFPLGIPQDYNKVLGVVKRTRKNLEGAESVSAFAKISAVFGFSFLITFDSACMANFAGGSHLLSMNIAVIATVAFLGLVSVLNSWDSNESKEDIKRGLNYATTIG